MEAQTETGEVMSWAEGRGFGFIAPDKGGPDVFVNYAVIEGAERLDVGDRVEFVAFSTPRGMRASMARKVAHE